MLERDELSGHTQQADTTRFQKPQREAAQNKRDLMHNDIYHTVITCACKRTYKKRKTILEDTNLTTQAEHKLLLSKTSKDKLLRAELPKMSAAATQWAVVVLQETLIKFYELTKIINN